jgi:repressor LexA
MESYLTPKQKQVLEWIESYLKEHHTMPSRREIATGLGLSSPATIQQHIEALETKGFLKRGENSESRGLQWTSRSKKLLTAIQANTTTLPFHAKERESEDFSHSSLPLLGSIAAGYPIEVFPETKTVNIPVDLFMPKNVRVKPPISDFYVLTVRGDSMINEGILSGDWVVIQNSKQARTGTTVAALLNGEATLKTLVKTKTGIELHPANPNYPIIPVGPEDRFEIQGVLVGLVRKFQTHS